MNDRKSIRLDEYDYSSEGYYFITVCVKAGLHVFGEIRDVKMIKNPRGEIAHAAWMQIPQHFKEARLDAFIVMPNHVHGIIIIDNSSVPVPVPIPVPVPVGNRHACSGRQYQTLPIIIGSYKSSVSRSINKLYPEIGFRWQKSYYDHIIRNEKALLNIRRYITENPVRWDSDAENK